MMKFTCTRIYALKGVVLPPESRHLEIVARDGFQAILTIDPDDYALDGDRMVAVGNAMLRGVFRAESGDVKERVAAGIEEIRAARRKRFERKPFLVLVAHGELDDIDTSVGAEADDYVVCFDAIDKNTLFSQVDHSFTAMIGALVAHSDSLLAISLATESAVVMRSDGKPVYSFTFRGFADAYAARRFDPGTREAIKALYRRLAQDHSLGRVRRLIQASLEMESDRLRSFMAAWNALEILVNKLFKVYERRFFHPIAAAQVAARQEVVRRIQEAMQARYRFGDKFAVVGIELSPATIDQDAALIAPAVKLRNNVMHGRVVDESTLPAKAVRDMASKYLRLHVEEEERRFAERRSP